MPVVTRAKGFYLLPNLFTLSALFAGFYAVVAAMKGNFDHAAIAIFVAMIMDGLDGRVARLTNTQTAFGAELDSLSDMVSFGVAPGLVIYAFTLHFIGKLGWLAAFFYTAAVALRLARFNTRQNPHDKRYFQGLPCPPAAGIIAGLVWVCGDYEVNGLVISILASILTPLVGLLMVSNIRYRSFKDLDLKDNVSFVVILFIVVAIVLISSDPPDILFGGFLLYGLSGPFLRIWHSYRKRHKQHRGPETKDIEHDNSHADSDPHQ